MMLSKNKDSLEYFRTSKVVELVRYVLNIDWKNNIIPYCC